MEFLASAGLGLGLAAAAGLRVFVPLLVLNLAARFELLTLQPELGWVGSTAALVAFSMAAVIEVVSYLVPLVDNLLDTLASPAAVLAGTLVMGSVLSDLSPLWTWALAIIAGGGTAAVVQGGSVAVRAVSTTTTGGAANPVVGASETAGSVSLSVLAVALPVIAAVLVVALLVFLIATIPKLWRRRRRSIGTAPQ